MMRKRGKGLKVAWAILGKPANESSGKYRSKSKKKRDETLKFQETSRVK
jgi:hypothetical protein